MGRSMNTCGVAPPRACDARGRRGIGVNRNRRRGCCPYLSHKNHKDMLYTCRFHSSSSIYVESPTKRITNARSRARRNASRLPSGIGCPTARTGAPHYQSVANRILLSVEGSFCVRQWSITKPIALVAACATLGTSQLGAVVAVDHLGPWGCWCHSRAWGCWCH